MAAKKDTSATWQHDLRFVRVRDRATRREKQSASIRRLRLPTCVGCDGSKGQIRGLQRMVEEDRYCADILTQVSSVQEALRSVARALMRNHLSHCASQAIRTGSTEERQAMYDELLELIYKNAR